MVKERRKKDIIDVRKAFPRFVSRVKAVLERRDLDRPELLSRTQLSRPTLNRLLDGEGNPLLGNLLDISQALGISLEELLGPQQLDSKQDFHPTDHPLLGTPPSGDPTAYWIYKQLCLGRSESEVAKEIEHGSFPNAGETAAIAVFRAVLDVYHNRQAWITAAALPRDRAREARIAEAFDLKERPELEDRVPVRVIDIAESMYRIIRISAIAAVSAEITREVMLTHHTLGIADGFSSAMWQLFLRRGALSHVQLVPLVVTPRWSQFKFSGNTLVGSMMLAHHGYRVGSDIELEKLKLRLQEVDHAVISCGPRHPEPNARLPRLIDGSPIDSGKFFGKLAKEKVVGDLLYHFLRADSSEAGVSEMTGDLSKIMDFRAGESLVYSTPLKQLAAIAERGVTLLQSHQADRAPVIAAALARRPRPVNFLVITKGIAQRLLGEDPE